MQVHGWQHCDHICPHDLSHSQVGHIFRCYHPTITGDVIRYLGPLCLCIPTPTLSHYQYTKPVLSISALFNSPRSSKPRQLSLPSRLSHLLSPNLDDGAGRHEEQRSHHPQTASPSTNCKFPSSPGGDWRITTASRPKRRRGPVGTTTTPSTAPRRAAGSTPAAATGSYGNRPSGERFGPTAPASRRPAASSAPPRTASVRRRTAASSRQLCPSTARIQN